MIFVSFEFIFLICFILFSGHDTFYLKYNKTPFRRPLSLLNLKPNLESSHLKKIIIQGEDWVSKQKSICNLTLLELPNQEYKEIKGCTSIVKLKVNIDNQNKLLIEGMADSKIVQGILAILATNLSSISPNDILLLSASKYSEEFQSIFSLPSHRTFSIQRIILEIQDRIRHFQSLNNPYSDLNISTQINQSEEIAVLLSGGVDSSVALAKLKDQGHKLRAYYLKIWLDESLSHLNECPWEEDLKYATSVCQQLDIPLEVVSLQKEYWDRVVNYVIEESRAGRTPNPDILCNSRVKFGAYFDRIGRLHKKIVSGHYANVVNLADALPQLTPFYDLEYLQSFDPSIDWLDYKLLQTTPDIIKDQTYFLAKLNQSQLQQCDFPLANLTKAQVRQLAQEYDLPTKTRKDSQGICFLGKLKYEDFLEHYLGVQNGEIRDINTDLIIGTHPGYWCFTIGQKRGLGKYINKYSHLGPWTVVKKDIPENILYVTNQTILDSDPLHQFCKIVKMDWTLGVPPKQSSLLNQPLTIKVRHGPQTLIGNFLEYHSDVQEGTLRFVTSDIALAPGQFAVFYSNGYCLGAGVIENFD